jgi:hypothetical protein
VHRIDFVFDAGDKLALLRGNGAASAPRYDLARLEAKVLASPAQPAEVGPAIDLAPKEPAGTPRWFWAAVIAAGLLVALVLSRTLRAPERAK